jgi:hypothetical protein
MFCDCLFLRPSSFLGLTDFKKYDKFPTNMSYLIYNVLQGLFGKVFFLVFGLFIYYVFFLKKIYNIHIKEFLKFL